MTKASVVFAILLVVSCSSKNLFELPNDGLELAIMKDSVTTSSCSITSDSFVYKNIYSWLSGNQEGWNKSTATYLPNMVITGGGFRAQVLKKSIVINDMWVHDISEIFYNSIKCP